MVIGNDCFGFRCGVFGCKLRKIIRKVEVNGLKNVHVLQTVADHALFLLCIKAINFLVIIKIASSSVLKGTVKHISGNTQKIDLSVTK